MSAMILRLFLLVGPLTTIGSLIADDGKTKARAPSATEITQLLERRWPLADIQTFCTPKNRWNPLFQGLVTDGEQKWEGELYKGKKTGFDKISWYANVTRGGVASEYSLNVKRGDEYWNLEIGDEQTMREQRKKLLK